jgi:hypothetical protein
VEGKNMLSIKHVDIQRLMEAPKPNSNSIRYSDMFKDIVSKAPGEGLNNKLAYIVFDYELTEKKRKNNIEELDAEIAKKQKELDTLLNKIRLVNDLAFAIEQTNRNIENIKTSINRLTAANK